MNQALCCRQLAFFADIKQLDCARFFALTKIKIPFLIINQQIGSSLSNIRNHLPCSQNVLYP